MCMEGQGDEEHGKVTLANVVIQGPSSDLTVGLIQPGSWQEIFHNLGGKNLLFSLMTT